MVLETVKYKRTVAQGAFFFFNGAYVLCGQFLHSNLVIRLKPFLTLLIMLKNHLRGREMDAELSHQRKQHYSSSIHPCLNRPLLEVWGYMICFMFITDVLENWCWIYSSSSTENVMFFMHVSKGMTCSCSIESGKWKSNTLCILKQGLKHFVIFMYILLGVLALLVDLSWNTVFNIALNKWCQLSVDE